MKNKIQNYNISSYSVEKFLKNIKSKIFILQRKRLILQKDKKWRQIMI